MSDAMSQRAELAVANHILFDRGVLDAYGHVSVREQSGPNRFLLARNMAPATVTEDDVQSLDFDGVTADPRPSYLERFLHGAIYRARPDVMAIVHSHSPAVLPFGVSKVPLRAILHMAGFLGVSTRVFEIRNYVGDGSDLLIRDGALGKAFAAELGDESVMLMRGHGSVAVGDSLKQAVFKAVFTEVNAHAQASAQQLGDPTFLTAEEGEAAWKSNNGQSARAWDFWKLQARATVQ